MKALKQTLTVVAAIVALMILLLTIVVITTADYTRDVTVEEKTGNPGFGYYDANLKESDANVKYQITRVYNVAVGMNGPNPAVLQLRKGDVVKLVLTTDVMCNFRIEGYGVKVPLYQEMTTELVFNTAKEGVFDYYCGSYDGRYDIRGIVKVN